MWEAEILVTEPMALMLCIWTALLLGILYMFFTAFGIVYTAYGLRVGSAGTNEWLLIPVAPSNMQSVGLSFSGIGIGIIAGVCCHPFWQRYAPF